LGPNGTHIGLNGTHISPKKGDMWVPLCPMWVLHGAHIGPTWDSRGIHIKIGAYEGPNGTYMGPIGTHWDTRGTYIGPIGAH
jgi:hypothetical protein